MAVSHMSVLTPPQSKAFFIHNNFNGELFELPNHYRFQLQAIHAQILASISHKAMTQNEETTSKAVCDYFGRFSEFVYGIPVGDESAQTYIVKMCVNTIGILAVYGVDLAVDQITHINVRKDGFITVHIRSRNDEFPGITLIRY